MFYKNNIAHGLFTKFSEPKMQLSITLIVSFILYVDNMYIKSN